MTKAILLPNWAPVGSGRFGLYHRPGRGVLGPIRQHGCDCVVTLLSAREGAPGIGQRVQALGMEWVWLPLENGQLPQGASHDMLAAALPALSARLDLGRTLLIHCSAGIHRTGMLIYGLLRWRGLPDAEAMSLIERARHHTAAGLQAKQKRWAEVVLGNNDPTGAPMLTFEKPDQDP